MLALFFCANALARDASFGTWDGEELEPHDVHRAINQAEWAAMLLEALGLADALPEDHDAEDLFSLLCAKRAPRRARADAGIPASGAPDVSIFEPRSAPNQGLRWVAKVPTTALYALSVTGRGAANWSIDRRPVGRMDPTALGRDVSRRLMALPRGFHEVEASAFRGQVETLSLVPYRNLCIAPAGGWRASAPLTYGAKARSLVRAFGIEDQLPHADEPVLIEGEAFSDASTGAVVSDRNLGAIASADRWGSAGTGTATFAYRLVLEEPALVSIAARVHGAERQLWSLDDHFVASVAPPPEALSFGWMKIFTLPLPSGEHRLRAQLPRGAGIDVIRVLPRRASDRDYLNLLESMGFSEGAPGETVSLRGAESNLSHPAFRPLTNDLLVRSFSGTARAIRVLQEDSRRHFERPLSPVVPSEL